jgi:23S rRNA pseudoU1915 N3-methylase RlmH
MTPAREWLKKDEVIQLVNDTVQKLFSEHNKKIDLRLNAQDVVLAEIKATQTANHAENSRRQDKTEKALSNLLQLGENQVLIQQGRDEQADENRKALADEIRRKDKSWERWKTRITVAAGLFTLFSGLGLLNYLHRLFLTGHLFSPVK